jgi:hypothetical protein
VTDSITPPPELVQQWYQDADQQLAPYYVFVAHCAAQWAANQELEACCEWVAVESIAAATELRAARRPKPPSLKEQALEAAIRLGKKYPSYEGADIETIRRALEALPE